jgi:hypothetical protein
VLVIILWKHQQVQKELLWMQHELKKERCSLWKHQQVQKELLWMQHELKKERCSLWKHQQQK